MGAHEGARCAARSPARRVPPLGGILELGAQWSVKSAQPTGDRLAAFGRYMAQLKPYYFDYRTSVPESAYRHQLIGAGLLCLLAENRIADFHMVQMAGAPRGPHQSPISGRS